MEKKNTVALICVCLLMVGLIISVPIIVNTYQTQALDTVYRDAAALMHEGKWKEACDILDTSEMRHHRNSKDLISYCKASLYYEAGQIDDAKNELRWVSAEYAKLDYVEEFRRRVNAAMPAYEERKRQEKEQEYRRQEAAARTGVPFVGMPESWIGITTLGKPDEHHSETKIKGDSKYNEELYRFRNSAGNVIFSARCAHGRVISASDYRDDPWVCKPFTPIKYKSDPYEADQYSDPEDFYYDHYDDFWDYEEAEDYYYEHCD